MNDYYLESKENLRTLYMTVHVYYTRTYQKSARAEREGGVCRDDNHQRKKKGNINRFFRLWTVILVSTSCTWALPHFVMCALVTCAGWSVVVIARVVALQGLVLSVAVAACSRHQDRRWLICRQAEKERECYTCAELFYFQLLRHAHNLVLQNSYWIDGVHRTSVRIWEWFFKVCWVPDVLF